VELMGGEIRVESELGQGSAVTVVLPRQRPIVDRADAAPDSPGTANPG
jgi:signal transduction histidine kinase